MKKLLLLLSAGIFTINVQAQRVTLIEDASGENCGPCASAIGPTESLIASTNGGALLIGYMVDIPTGGTLYNTTKSFIIPRKSYYGINYAPNVRINGREPNPGAQYPGLPGYLTKAMIDGDNATAPPIDIVTTHEWISGDDSVKVTVEITATNADYNPSLGTRLQIILTEDLHFTTPPGSTSQKDFNHTARQLFPGNNWTGTTITTIKKGETKTFTYTEAKQSYVDASNDIHVVAFVQEGNKNVVNASQSKLVWPTYINNAIVADNNFKLYPNPAVDQSYVSVTFSEATIGTISVTDMLGRQVFNSGDLQFEARSNTYAIPTSNLTNGTYLVTIRTENNNMITNRLAVSK